jgi:hypothetical protein
MSGITTAQTLEELHAALREAGILGPDPRFMHVELDITSRCNIRCVMCYHSFDEYAKSKAVLLSVETFDAFAAALPPRCCRGRTP